MIDILACLWQISEVLEKRGEKTNVNNDNIYSKEIDYLYMYKPILPFKNKI